MLQYQDVKEILKEVEAEPQSKSISRIEDAFLKCQSDLEWLYVICNASQESMSLQIFKTSNPYTDRRFVWTVWFSYREYLKPAPELCKQMEIVELVNGNILHALHEFEKAEPGPDSDKPGNAQAKKPGESNQQIRGQKADSSLETAKDRLARYAACLFEPSDILEVRRLPSGTSTWHEAGRLCEAAGSLLNDNQHNQHIYIGANPRCIQGGTRSKDVACARCLFVDFDGMDADAAKSRWRNIRLPTPTITISSEHGIHAYWRLNEQITDMALWTKLQKRLIALLDSDGAVHDPARIMRLPGFMNHKEPVAACRIIDDDQRRMYDLNSLMASMYSVITESDYAAQYQARWNDTGQLNKPFHGNISNVKIAKLTAAKWLGAIKGRRNCKAFKNAAYLLKNLGLTEKQAWPILRKWNRKNKPPLPEYELHQVLQNAGIYGRQTTGRDITSRS